MRVVGGNLHEIASENWAVPKEISRGFCRLGIWHCAWVDPGLLGCRDRVSDRALLVVGDPTSADLLRSLER